MSSMFNAATSFNQDLNLWDVSNNQTLRFMFRGASSFNGDISDWNVSSATNTEEMFNNANSFNQDISGWNVSNVASMRFMFIGASTFNQDISGWDVSSVTNMDEMLNGASSFDQDLTSWCVLNISSPPVSFAPDLDTTKHPNWGTCNDYYVNARGCVVCDSLNIGDLFILNGDNDVVDRPMLDSMVTGGYDVTKACVSHDRYVVFSLSRLQL